MFRRFLIIPVILTLISVAPSEVFCSETLDTIEFGGELRLRDEAFNNLRDLTDTVDDDAGEPVDSTYDNYNFYRFRVRFWAEARPRDNLTLHFRLGHEYRMGRGENTSGIRDPEGKIGIDNAWARIDRGRLSFTFGRMNLMYGEGFLVFDGTPADGSGSAYFDALKLTVHTRRGFDVDLFAAKIDEEGFGTDVEDEDLYGIYSQGEFLHAYILYRNKRQATESGSGTVRPKRETAAFGARLAKLPDFGYRWAMEGALQIGEVEENDSKGFGGYARFGWNSRRGIKPGFEFGGVYLSGDDRETEEYEGWDGFYGEWPKYSELYVYTMYDNTSRIQPNESGTWTNMFAGWAQANIVLNTCRISGRVTSFHAAEESTGPGNGTERGLLIAGRADIPLGTGVKGQLLGEHFSPGDFYEDNADPAWYFRGQITASF